MFTSMLLFLIMPDISSTTIGLRCSQCTCYSIHWYSSIHYSQITRYLYLDITVLVFVPQELFDISKKHTPAVRIKASI